MDSLTGNTENLKLDDNPPRTGIEAWERYVRARAEVRRLAQDPALQDEATGSAERQQAQHNLDAARSALREAEDRLRAMGHQDRLRARVQDHQIAQDDRTEQITSRPEETTSSLGLSDEIANVLGGSASDTTTHELTHPQDESRTDTNSDDLGSDTDHVLAPASDETPPIVYGRALLDRESAPHSDVTEKYRLAGGGSPFTYRDPKQVVEHATGSQHFPHFTAAQPFVHPEHPKLQVSGDGTLAIAAHGQRAKEFFATREVVDRSNAQLKRIGSKVSLDLDEKTFVTIGEDERRLFKISPRLDGETTDVCRDFSAGVLGGQHTHVVLADTRLPGSGGTGQVHKAVIDAGSSMQVSGTHELAEALASLKDDPEGRQRSDARWASRIVRGAVKTYADDTPVPAREYVQSFSRKDAGSSRWGTEVAAQLGINEHAFPKVGEAYLLQSISHDVDETGAHVFSMDFGHDPHGHRPPEGVFGYHYASVVVESADGQHHIVIENGRRRDYDRAFLRDVIARNVEYYSEHRDELAHAIAKNPLRAGAKNAESVILAHALNTLVTGGDEHELAAARIDAVRALSGMLKGDFGAGGDQWWCAMLGRAPGETMFENDAHLRRIVNPLVMTVVAQRDNKAIAEFDKGITSLTEVDREGLAALVRKIDPVVAWHERYGLPLPQIKITVETAPGDHGKRRQRAEAVERALREELAAIRKNNGGQPMDDIPVTMDYRTRAAQETGGDAGATRSVVNVDVFFEGDPSKRLAELARATGVHQLWSGPLSKQLARLSTVSAAELRRMSDIIKVGAPLNPRRVDDSGWLTDVRRLSDVVQREIAPNTQFTTRQLDKLVRQVFGMDPRAKVGMADRRVVVDLVSSAKQPGKRVQLADLTEIVRDMRGRFAAARGDVNAEHRVIEELSRRYRVHEDHARRIVRWRGAKTAETMQSKSTTDAASMPSEPVLGSDEQAVDKSRWRDALASESTLLQGKTRDGSMHLFDASQVQINELTDSDGNLIGVTLNSDREGSRDFPSNEIEYYREWAKAKDRDRTWLLPAGVTRLARLSDKQLDGMETPTPWAQGVPGGKPPLFIVVHATPEAFEMKLPSASGKWKDDTVQVDGATFVEVLAKSSVFQKVLEATGASSYVLFACNAGQIGKAHGAAWMFRDAIERKIGHENPVSVFAATKKITTVRRGEPAGGVVDGGEWREFTDQGVRSFGGHDDILRRAGNEQTADHQQNSPEQRGPNRKSTGGNIAEQRDLGPDDHATSGDELAKTWLRDVGSSWAAAKAEYLDEGAGVAGREKMARLVAFRKRFVDGLLDEILRDYPEVTPIAVGSTDLTSDYDVTVTGPGDTEVVEEFNKRFRLAWDGGESATVFDTNIYGNAFLPESGIRRLPLMPVSVEGRLGRARDQDIAALTKLTLYMTESEWNDYLERLFERITGSGYTDDLPAIQDLAAWAEADIHDVADWTGIGVQELATWKEVAARHADAVELNSESRESREKASFLRRNSGHDATGKSSEQPEDRSKPARHSRPDDNVIRIKNFLYPQQLGTARDVAGKYWRRRRFSLPTEEARTLDRIAKNVGRLTNSSLTHAEEPYFSEGAILDVVGNQQAGGSRELTANQYLQSMNENFGDFLKDMKHYAGDAGRAFYRSSKYLGRLVSAAERTLRKSWDDLGGGPYEVSQDPRLSQDTKNLLSRLGKLVDADTGLLAIRRGKKAPYSEMSSEQRSVVAIELVRQVMVAEKLSEQHGAAATEYMRQVMARYAPTAAELQEWVTTLAVEVNVAVRPVTHDSLDLTVRSHRGSQGSVSSFEPGFGSRRTSASSFGSGFVSRRASAPSMSSFDSGLDSRRGSQGSVSSVGSGFGSRRTSTSSMSQGSRSDSRRGSMWSIDSSELTDAGPRRRSVSSGSSQPKRRPSLLAALLQRRLGSGDPLFTALSEEPIAESSEAANAGGAAHAPASETLGKRSWSEVQQPSEDVSTTPNTPVSGDEVPPRKSAKTGDEFRPTDDFPNARGPGESATGVHDVVMTEAGARDTGGNEEPIGEQRAQWQATFDEVSALVARRTRPAGVSGQAEDIAARAGVRPSPEISDDVEGRLRNLSEWEQHQEHLEMIGYVLRSRGEQAAWDFAKGLAKHNDLYDPSRVRRLGGTRWPTAGSSEAGPSGTSSPRRKTVASPVDTSLSDGNSQPNGAIVQPGEFVPNPNYRPEPVDLGAERRAAWEAQFEELREWAAKGKWNADALPPEEVRQIARLTGVQPPLSLNVTEEERSRFREHLAMIDRVLRQDGRLEAERFARGLKEFTDFYPEARGLRGSSREGDFASASGEMDLDDFDVEPLHDDGAWVEELFFQEFRQASAQPGEVREEAGVVGSSVDDGGAWVEQLFLEKFSDVSAMDVDGYRSSDARVEFGGRPGSAEAGGSSSSVLGRPEGGTVDSRHGEAIKEGIRYWRRLRELPDGERGRLLADPVRRADLAQRVWRVQGKRGYEALAKLTGLGVDVLRQLVGEAGGRTVDSPHRELIWEGIRYWRRLRELPDGERGRLLADPVRRADLAQRVRRAQRSRGYEALAKLTGLGVDVLRQLIGEAGRRLEQPGVVREEAGVVGSSVDDGGAWVEQLFLEKFSDVSAMDVDGYRSSDARVEFGGRPGSAEAGGSSSSVLGRPEGGTVDSRPGEAFKGGIRYWRRLRELPDGERGRLLADPVRRADLAQRVLRAQRSRGFEALAKLTGLGVDVLRQLVGEAGGRTVDSRHGEATKGGIRYWRRWRELPDGERGRLLADPVERADLAQRVRRAQRVRGFEALAKLTGLGVDVLRQLVGEAGGRTVDSRHGDAVREGIRYWRRWRELPDGERGRLLADPVERADLAQRVRHAQRGRSFEALAKLTGLGVPVLRQLIGEAGRAEGRTADAIGAQAGSRADALVEAEVEAYQAERRASGSLYIVDRSQLGPFRERLAAALTSGDTDLVGTITEELRRRLRGRGFTGEPGLAGGSRRVPNPPGQGESSTAAGSSEEKPRHDRDVDMQAKIRRRTAPKEADELVELELAGFKSWNPGYAGDLAEIKAEFGNRIAEALDSNPKGLRRIFAELRGRLNEALRKEWQEKLAEQQEWLARSKRKGNEDPSAEVLAIARTAGVGLPLNISTEGEAGRQHRAEQQLFREHLEMIEHVLGTEGVQAARDFARGFARFSGFYPRRGGLDGGASNEPAMPTHPTGDDDPAVGPQSSGAMDLDQVLTGDIDELLAAGRSGTTWQPPQRLESGELGSYSTDGRLFEIVRPDGNYLIVDMRSGEVFQTGRYDGDLVTHLWSQVSQQETVHPVHDNEMRHQDPHASAADGANRTTRQDVAEAVAAALSGDWAVFRGLYGNLSKRHQGMVLAEPGVGERLRASGVTNAERANQTGISRPTLRRLFPEAMDTAVAEVAEVVAAASAGDWAVFKELYGTLSKTHQGMVLAEPVVVERLRASGMAAAALADLTGIGVDKLRKLVRNDLDATPFSTAALLDDWAAFKELYGNLPPNNRRGEVLAVPVVVEWFRASGKGLAELADLTGISRPTLRKLLPEFAEAPTTDVIGESSPADLVAAASAGDWAAFKALYGSLSSKGHRGMVLAEPVVVEWFRASGKTPAELEDLTGVSDRTVSKLLSGAADAPVAEVVAAASAGDWAAFKELYGNLPPNNRRGEVLAVPVVVEWFRASGKGLAELADLTGISRPTLRRLFPEAMDTAVAADAPVAEVVAAAAAGDWAAFKELYGNLPPNNRRGEVLAVPVVVEWFRASGKGLAELADLTGISRPTLRRLFPEAMDTAVAEVAEVVAAAAAGDWAVFKGLYGNLSKMYRGKVLAEPVVVERLRASGMTNAERANQTGISMSALGRLFPKAMETAVNAGPSSGVRQGSGWRSRGGLLAKWKMFFAGRGEGDVTGTVFGKKVSFSGADVQSTALMHGGRAVGVTFHSKDLGNSLSWAESGGAALLPGGENSFVINAHGRGKSFEVALKDGATAWVDGANFAKIVAQTNAFNTAKQEDAPASYMLLACRTGKYDGPGGASFDFQRMLSQLGRQATLYAPTRDVEIGVDENNRAFTKPAGEWRAWLWGEDADGGKHLIDASRIKITALADKNGKTIGVTLMSDREGTEEEPYDEIRHYQDWARNRDHDRTVLLPPGVRRPAELNLDKLMAADKPAPWTKDGKRPFFLTGHAEPGRIGVEVASSSGKWNDETYRFSGETLAQFLETSNVFQQAWSKYRSHEDGSGEYTLIACDAAKPTEEGTTFAGDLWAALRSRPGYAGTLYAATEPLSTFSMGMGAATYVQNGGRWLRFDDQGVHSHGADDAKMSPSDSSKVDNDEKASWSSGRTAGLKAGPWGTKQPGPVQVSGPTQAKPTPVATPAKPQAPEPHSQQMIAGAADLQVGRVLRETDPKLKARLLAELERDASVSVAYPDRADVYRRLIEGPQPDWSKLTENQVWALVAAERKGLEQAAANFAAIKDRLGHESWFEPYRQAYPGEALDRLIHRVADHIAAHWQLVTNYPFEKHGLLGSLMESGTFRNRWETGVSGGSVSKSTRGGVEERFGYAAALGRTGGGYQDESPFGGSFRVPDPSELPKYAALVSEYHGFGGSNRYGDTVVRWKEHVRPRVTYTPNDSFSGDEHGARALTGSRQPLSVLAYTDRRQLKLAFADLTGFVHAEEETLSMVGYGVAPTGDYIEAQIHGNLTWDDVDEIVISHDDVGPDSSLSYETASSIKDRLDEFQQRTGHDFRVRLSDAEAERRRFTAPVTEIKSSDEQLDYRLRRYEIDTADGRRWVREHTIELGLTPADGIGPQAVQDLKRQLNRAIDAVNDHENLAPSNGDLLRFRLEFTANSPNQVRVVSGRDTSDPHSLVLTDSVESKLRALLSRVGLEHEPRPSGRIRTTDISRLDDAYEAAGVDSLRYGERTAPLFTPHSDAARREMWAAKLAEQQAWLAKGKRRLTAEPSAEVLEIAQGAGVRPSMNISTEGEAGRRHRAEQQRYREHLAMIQHALVREGADAAREFAKGLAEFSGYYPRHGGLLGGSKGSPDMPGLLEGDSAESSSAAQHTAMDVDRAEELDHLQMVVVDDRMQAAIERATQAGADPHDARLTAIGHRLANAGLRPDDLHWFTGLGDPLTGNDLVSFGRWLNDTGSAPDQLRALGLNAGRDAVTRWRFGLTEETLAEVRNAGHIPEAIATLARDTGLASSELPALGWYVRVNEPVQRIEAELARIGEESGLPRGDLLQVAIRLQLPLDELGPAHSHIARMRDRGDSADLVSGLIRARLGQLGLTPDRLSLFNQEWFEHAGDELRQKLRNVGLSAANIPMLTGMRLRPGDLEIPDLRTRIDDIRWLDYPGPDEAATAIFGPGWRDSVPEGSDWFELPAALDVLRELGFSAGSDAAARLARWFGMIERVPRDSLTELARKWRAQGVGSTEMRTEQVFEMSFGLGIRPELLAAVSSEFRNFTEDPGGTIEILLTELNEYGLREPRQRIAFLTAALQKGIEREVWVDFVNYLAETHGSQPHAWSQLPDDAQRDIVSQWRRYEAQALRQDTANSLEIGLSDLDVLDIEPDATLIEDVLGALGLRPQDLAVFRDLTTGIGIGDLGELIDLNNSVLQDGDPLTDEDLREIYAAVDKLDIDVDRETITRLMLAWPRMNADQLGEFVTLLRDHGLDFGRADQNISDVLADLAEKGVQPGQYVEFLRSTDELTLRDLLSMMDDPAKPFAKMGGRLGDFVRYVGEHDLNLAKLRYAPVLMREMAARWLVGLGPQSEVAGGTATEIVQEMHQHGIPAAEYPLVAEMFQRHPDAATRWREVRELAELWHTSDRMALILRDLPLPRDVELDLSWLGDSKSPHPAQVADHAISDWLGTAGLRFGELSWFAGAGVVGLGELSDFRSFLADRGVTLDQLRADSGLRTELVGKWVRFRDAPLPMEEFGALERFWADRNRDVRLLDQLVNRNGLPRQELISLSNDLQRVPTEIPYLAASRDFDAATLLRAAGALHAEPALLAARFGPELAQLHSGQVTLEKWAESMAGHADGLGRRDWSPIRQLAKDLAPDRVAAVKEKHLDDWLDPLGFQPKDLAWFHGIDELTATDLVEFRDFLVAAGTTMAQLRGNPQLRAQRLQEWLNDPARHLSPGDLREQRLRKLVEEGLAGDLLEKLSDRLGRVPSELPRVAAAAGLDAARLLRFAVELQELTGYVVEPARLARRAGIDFELLEQATANARTSGFQLYQEFKELAGEQPGDPRENGFLTEYDLVDEDVFGSDWQEMRDIATALTDAPLQWARQLGLDAFLEPLAMRLRDLSWFQGVNGFKVGDLTDFRKFLDRRGITPDQLRSNGEEQRRRLTANWMNTRIRPLGVEAWQEDFADSGWFQLDRDFRRLDRLTQAVPGLRDVIVSVSRSLGRVPVEILEVSRGLGISPELLLRSVSELRMEPARLADLFATDLRAMELMVQRRQDVGRLVDRFVAGVRTAFVDAGLDGAADHAALSEFLQGVNLRDGLPGVVVLGRLHTVLGEFGVSVADLLTGSERIRQSTAIIFDQVGRLAGGSLRDGLHRFHGYLRNAAAGVDDLATLDPAHVATLVRVYFADRPVDETLIPPYYPAPPNYDGTSEESRPEYAGLPAVSPRLARLGELMDIEAQLLEPFGAALEGATEAEFTQVARDLQDFAAALGAFTTERRRILFAAVASGAAPGVGRRTPLRMINALLSRHIGNLDELYHENDWLGAVDWLERLDAVSRPFGTGEDVSAFSNDPASPAEFRFGLRTLVASHLELKGLGFVRYAVQDQGQGARIQRMARLQHRLGVNVTDRLRAYVEQSRRIPDDLVALADEIGLPDGRGWLLLEAADQLRIDLGLAWFFRPELAELVDQNRNVTDWSFEIQVRLSQAGVPERLLDDGSLLNELIRRLWPSMVGLSDLGGLNGFLLAHGKSLPDLINMSPTEVARWVEDWSAGRLGLQHVSLGASYREAIRQWGGFVQLTQLLDSHGLDIRNRPLLLAYLVDQRDPMSPAEFLAAAEEAGRFPGDILREWVEQRRAPLGISADRFRELTTSTRFRPTGLAEVMTRLRNAGEDVTGLVDMMALTLVSPNTSRIHDEAGPLLRGFATWAASRFGPQEPMSSPLELLDFRIAIGLWGERCIAERYAELRGGLDGDIHGGLVARTTLEAIAVGLMARPDPTTGSWEERQRAFVVTLVAAQGLLASPQYEGGAVRTWRAVPQRLPELGAIHTTDRLVFAEAGPRGPRVGTQEIVYRPASGQSWSPAARRLELNVTTAKHIVGFPPGMRFRLVAVKSTDQIGTDGRPLTQVIYEEVPKRAHQAFDDAGQRPVKRPSRMPDQDDDTVTRNDRVHQDDLTRLQGNVYGVNPAHFGAWERYVRARAEVERWTHDSAWQEVGESSTGSVARQRTQQHLDAARVALREAEQGLHSLGYHDPDAIFAEQRARQAEERAGRDADGHPGGGAAWQSQDSRFDVRTDPDTGMTLTTTLHGRQAGEFALRDVNGVVVRQRMNLLGFGQESLGHVITDRGLNEATYYLSDGRARVMRWEPVSDREFQLIDPGSGSYLRFDAPTRTLVDQRLVPEVLPESAFDWASWLDPVPLPDGQAVVRYSADGSLAKLLRRDGTYEVVDSDSGVVVGAGRHDEELTGWLFVQAENPVFTGSVPGVLDEDVTMAESVAQGEAVQDGGFGLAAVLETDSGNAPRASGSGSLQEEHSGHREEGVPLESSVGDAGGSGTAQPAGRRPLGRKGSEQRRQIEQDWKNRYLNGATVRDLVRETGYAVRTVRQVLKDAGLKIHNESRTPPRRGTHERKVLAERLRREYEANPALTIADLVEEYSYSYGRVHEMLREAGTAIRRSGRPGNELPAPGTQEREVLADRLRREYEASPALGIADLAEKYPYSYRGITRLLREAGTAMRRQNVPGESSSSAPNPAPGW
ncbi:DUF3626 domain-containing protein, partial [Saccharopolyspora shandongensis]|uniref:DUF3626 domain-containing protein n=1 Tax=Saccharopolyspora shandongensis TaxID=418495 RepID=UPI0033E6D319